MCASRIESEFNEIDSKNGWHTLFQEVKERSDRQAKDKNFTLTECNNSENRQYNRYRDVSPYDHSRIILHRGGVDYINANLVKMEKANRKYILTQGPLSNTVGHFWLMVWEQNSAAILMLNKIIENRQLKCHQYWPKRIGYDHRMQLEDVGLTVEYLKCEEFTNFSKRTFRLTDTDSTKSREVIQFHYTTWPDFYIPSSPIAFLQFLKNVRDSGALNRDVGPAVVHCSAGIGRSGTFALVDTCLVLVEKEGENCVNVSDILVELRQSRMGLIQTVDQLYFSYQAIIEGIKLLNDPSFKDYEEVPVLLNEDNDGENDEAPPPPARGTSLVRIANENLMEARKNAENIENDHGERPLPPIPARVRALVPVDETNNSDSEDIVEDESSDDDIISESESDNDQSPLNQNSSNAGANESSMLMNGNHEIDESFDAYATLPPSPSKSTNTNSGGTEPNSVSNSSFESALFPDSESTSNAELRKRKRQERHTAMEDKITEIKRKQKACEAAAEAAPKKRRSIMIFTGVVVCAICCAYIYTKFG